MELLRLIFISILLLIFSGCAMLGVDGPINFQDGTWSSCTYSKPDGATFTGPLQLGGTPLEFTDPDGTKVKCVPMPAAPKPE